ncbi:hypothetical protein R6Q57_028808 [Mikania cordata]
MRMVQSLVSLSPRQFFCLMRTTKAIDCKSLPSFLHRLISAGVQYELVQAFRIIDTDGDGRITKSELEALLSRIGGSEPISQDELRSMINEIDTDGDGSVSLQEFGLISAACGPPSGVDELRCAFEFFDADHDGMIKAEELFAVFEFIGDGRCTLDECKRMISSVDKNGDGFVCFEY